MNLSKHIAAWILVVPLILLSLTTFAEPPDPFKSRLLPLELVMQFRTEIGFNKEQQEALGKLVVATQKSVVEKQWVMQSAYFDLIEALDQEIVDEEPALGHLKTAVEAENNIKLEQVRLLIRVRNLLKPEQIEFLRARVAEGWTENAT